jgi:hypothetical protein
LQPGESVEHVELWFLFGGVVLGETEDEMAAALEPILKQTAQPQG